MQTESAGESELRHPLISVVIPARNAAATLPACLDALAGQGVPGPHAELIVVDDGSTDDTAAIGSRPGLLVLRSRGRGAAAARNVGATAAAGDILVFLDADTVPLPGWLAEMVQPLEDPGVVAVKGAYRSRQTSLVARFTQLEFEWKYDRLARASQVDFVDTGTAAFRRNALLASGGFDEGYSSSEDVDLAFRLAKTGARFVFNPRATVLHRHTEGLAEYLRKKAHHGYTRTLVYRRYLTKSLGDSYTPPMLGAQVALAGLTGALGVLSLARIPRARTALATTLSAFLLTTLPLLRRAGTADLPLLAFMPLLAYARAWALGLGMVWGLASRAARRSSCYLSLAESVSTAE